MKRRYIFLVLKELILVQKEISFLEGVTHPVWNIQTKLSILMLYGYNYMKISLIQNILSSHTI